MRYFDFMFTSQALVSIERPARWAKQLASHLGHKITINATDDGYHYETSAAQADVIVGEDSLAFNCSADSVEALEGIQNVLQKHLVRFAADLSPEFNWVRA